ncbi:DUF7139 domain-containing protein [Halosolutus gelatinilyticus]|uniref:DUF7139 domain-containing protein n=1 Tax=Halosolutus gelatinilyticus TaxID=2931975 RepID=UPI001FF3BF1B|nr:hypothetical protein [Halosolutus gelatinilyticus]
MTSLTEVYDGTAREAASLRRLYAGTALVCLGAVLSMVAVLVPTTDPFTGYVVELTAWEMGDHYAAVRVAGVLAGIGVPAALMGVFVVFPAGRRVRAAAAISASLCLLGVALFWHAYPYHWRGYGEDLTLHVSAIYLLGLFMAVCCLFIGVVNFKTRNAPGGMLEMNVTRKNKTVVEYDETNEAGGLGGIGFLGGTPDGDVETQTNAADGGGGWTSPSAERSPSGSGSNPARGVGAATSDGGSATADIRSPLDASAEGADAKAVGSASTSAGPTDRYCGNCSHFEYVRSDSGMTPYCARHEAAMDDMDACEEWTPNRR